MGRKQCGFGVAVLEDGCGIPNSMCVDAKKHVGSKAELRLGAHHGVVFHFRLSVLHVSDFSNEVCLQGRALCSGSPRCTHKVT